MQLLFISLARENKLPQTWTNNFDFIPAQASVSSSTLFLPPKIQKTLKLLWGEKNSLWACLFVVKGGFVQKSTFWRFLSCYNVIPSKTNPECCFDSFTHAREILDSPVELHLLVQSTTISVHNSSSELSLQLSSRPTEHLSL